MRACIDCEHVEKRPFWTRNEILWAVATCGYSLIFWYGFWKNNRNTALRCQHPKALEKGKDDFVLGIRRGDQQKYCSTMRLPSYEPDSTKCGPHGKFFEPRNKQ